MTSEKDPKGANKGAKKGKKKNTQTLGEFLEPLGHSWASEDEVEIPQDTLQSGKRTDNWRGGGGGGGDSGSSQRRSLPDKPPFTLYVGGLSYSSTLEEIAEFFQIREKKIRMVMEGGRSKGFCYVEFPSREALEEALKKNGEVLGGRSVKLDVAESKKGGGRQRFNNAEGGRTGGGFGEASDVRGFMGTGQVETPSQGQNDGRRPRENGGRQQRKPGGYDVGRNAFGSESNPAEQRRGNAEFSREAFGEEKAERQAGERKERKEFNRDEMGTAEAAEHVEREPRERRPPRERVAGRSEMGTGEVPEHTERRFGKRDQPTFSRDTMGTEEQQQQAVHEQKAEKESTDRRGGHDISRSAFGEQVSEKVEEDEVKDEEKEGETAARTRPGATMTYNIANAPTRSLFGESAVREEPKPQQGASSEGAAGAGDEAKVEESKPRSSEPFQARSRRNPPRQPQQSQQPPASHVEEKRKEPREQRKKEITQAELFNQQQTKVKKQKEQEIKKASTTTSGSNTNPFLVLTKPKKSKPKKKKKSTENSGDEEADEEDEESGNADVE